MAATPLAALAQAPAQPMQDHQMQQPTQDPMNQPASPTPSEVQATYTDEQLRAFNAAADEIKPIAEQMAMATESQKATHAQQIREVLARHSLNVATYNAIAQRAQGDAEFAARVASLRTETAPQG
jgi:hypothetical protein